VTKGKSSAGMPTRLVIVPREPEAAQRARELARRNAGDWDYWASEAATLMAGYLMLLTSLPAEAWPPLRVLASYRLCWQVELAPAVSLGMIAS